MTSFNEIIRKDVTVGDVHVSSALGNSGAPQLPFPKMEHPVRDSHAEPLKDKKRRKKKERNASYAFIAPGAKKQVLPEQRGTTTNYPPDDDDAGVRYDDVDSASTSVSKGNEVLHWYPDEDEYTDDRSDEDSGDVGDGVDFDDYNSGPRPGPNPNSGRRGNSNRGRSKHTRKRYGSTADLPDAVKNKLKGKKRRQWMHVWNSEYDAHGDEGRSFAAAWSAVKKGSDALAGDPIVGVGGRRLEPFDAGTFFVPMRYDPSALSYLRADQVPRFLDALSHPDRLPVRPIAIGDLVAVKGRVSRETIEKHLDRMSKEKGSVHPFVSDEHLEGPGDLDPPVVVRMNGSFYLVDGHDRCVAMWLDGVDTVQVAFDDIDAFDYRKPDEDDLHKETAYQLLQGVNGRTLTNYVNGSLSVPFMYDEAFFSGLRPDQVPKFTYAVTHPDKLADGKVALASLVAIQNRVNADTVAAKVEKPWKKPPVIVRKNEVNYIADGHDRLTASWLRGEDVVPVKLTDITWADNTMKPRDLVKATIEDRKKAKEKLAAADQILKEAVESTGRLRAQTEASAKKTIQQIEEEAAAAERERERRAVEAEKLADTKIVAADDYALEIQREVKKLHRYVQEQQESVDRQVAKIVADAENYAEEKRAEADLLIKSTAIATVKTDKKIKKKEAKADQKRAAADRYEAEKRFDMEQRDLDRRRELAKYEFEQLEKMKGPVSVLKRGLQSGDFQMRIDIQKASSDRQQVFGWASVVTKGGKPVIDKQGDIIPVDELEIAAYDYMLKSRDGGNMHVRKGVARCIESVMLSYEKQAAMGIDPLLDKEGWWIGMQVDCPDLWTDIKSGYLPEFSIGGQAISTKLED